MSWINTLWPMIAAACLTLAVIYFLVWCSKRTAWAYLFFAIAAAGTAAFGVCELWMMRAQTPRDFGLAVRWAHLPAWVILLALVGFVRIYLRAGRPWLGWTACGLRTLALVVNFLSHPNLNYREITAVRHITFLGESISFGEGVASPWAPLAQFSLFLFVIFAADAAVTVWRRGDRVRAALVGGSIVFFTLAATAQVVLYVSGLLPMPLTVSFFFSGMILAMAFELSREVLLAGRLADEVRESEARFRGVADTAPVMIWMSGTDKLCNFFNKGWLHFTGRALEQELGNGWAESVHRDDLQGCMGTYSEAFDARRPFTMEYRLRRQDGQYRWISDTGVPRYDPERNFLGYIGSCVDLTERKEADERFRLAVEASPNGIVLVNPEGRIVLVNAETENLFGYAREEMLGQTVEMLLPNRYRGAHPGYRAEFFGAPRARAMGAGRELFARRKDGTEFPVEIGLSPINTEQGTLVLTAIVDITARKHSEREIAQHRKELAHLSRVTTVSELSGSLAHELNQPLAIILSNAQAAQRLLAQQPPDIAEVRDILEDIISEDQRAGEVIRRLRAMLKRGEIELQPLAVNDIVEDVLRLAASDLVEHSVVVQRRLLESTLRFLGDRIQIQQVLLNLVLNACDAMAASPPDHRRLTFAAAHHNSAVRISIFDTGCGFADPERLFEPFYTTKSQGLGLGLTICRSIAVAHNGRLWAEAPQAPDRGATFHLELPAVS